MAKLVDLKYHIIVDCLNALSVVVDIGAHHGDFARRLIARYHCRVFAYEPWPPNFDALCADRPVGLTAFNMGVTGSRAADSTITDYGNGGYSCSMLPRKGGIYKAGKSEKANVVEIDSVLVGHKHIDLLKIDAEGMEFDILSEVDEELIARCDQVAVEFHCGPGRGFDKPFSDEEYRAIIHKMGVAGFNALMVSPKGPEVLFYKPWLYYPKYAQRGAYHWEHYKSNREFRSYVDWLVSRFPKRGTVLDMGCGDGLIASKLAARGLKVTGIDTDPTAVALAAKKAPGVKFRVMSFEAIHKNSVFDYVLCHNVIEHVKDPGALLEKIVAAARKWAIVSTGDSDKGGWESIDAHRFTKKSFEELLRAGGLNYRLLKSGRWIYYEVKHGD